MLHGKEIESIYKKYNLTIFGCLIYLILCKKSKILICNHICVMCHLPGVTCRVSTVTWRVSLTPTAIATDSSPYNSPQCTVFTVSTTVSRLVCNDPLKKIKKIYKSMLALFWAKLANFEPALRSSLFCEESVYYFFLFWHRLLSEWVNGIL